jgi:large subunit ribosomal protein L24
MAKSMRIRTDDMVKVIGGKDSGKTGRVLRTDPKRSFVYVEGVSMVKRHEKARPTQDVQKASQQLGGIVDKEGPIHVSNVMLLDPKDNKPTRIGMRPGKDGKRERFAKRSGVSL